MRVNERRNIVFIGAGKLATNLSVALREAGFHIAQVYSRTESSARLLAGRLGCDWTNATANINEDADIYIYALTDSVLPYLANLPIGKDNALHLHTAGSMEKEVFRNKKKFGVLYPFQSFSKERLVAFTHIPILAEGNDKATEEEICDLARHLSDNVYKAGLEQRERLHLAGVFANNFTNCMYAIAEEELQKAHLPFSLLLPLIEETAHRVADISPREAQTGPAVRHDKNVMNKHLELLKDDSSLEQLYRIISANIENHEK